MSQPSVNLATRSLPVALPVTTAVLGLLGFGGGLYNFINPAEGARAFGILLPRSVDALNSNSEPDARQRAYIQIHGIRNIATGLSLFGLVGYLQFSSLCQSSPLVALGIRRSLGISLTVGSIVGVVDGYILSQFGKSDDISNEAWELSVKQSKGHMFIAMPILGLGLAWLYS